MLLSILADLKELQEIQYNMIIDVIYVFMCARPVSAKHNMDQHISLEWA
jgi:hypothetical protein